jgi:hypothetical protein
MDKTKITCDGTVVLTTMATLNERWRDPIDELEYFVPFYVDESDHIIVEHKGKDIHAVYVNGLFIIRKTERASLHPWEFPAYEDAMKNFHVRFRADTGDSRDMWATRLADGEVVTADIYEENGWAVFPGSKPKDSLPDLWGHHTADILLRDENFTPRDLDRCLHIRTDEFCVEPIPHNLLNPLHLWSFKREPDLYS